MIAFLTEKILIITLLYSPGSTSVLPTILFLITGVLREMSNKGAEKKSPLLVQGCLTALRTLCCSSFLEDEDVGYNWKELLRSALVTVLQNSKPGMNFMLSI